MIDGKGTAMMLDTLHSGKKSTNSEIFLMTDHIIIIY
jgi:hypothetical protein